MTIVSDVDVLEKEVFLCTTTNSTRGSLESLMKKVSQFNISKADPVALEKLHRMKTNLEGLIERMEPRDNYRSNWSFNGAGVIVGLIAAGVALLLVVALR